ncbi:hypothetical protein NEPAR06_0738 [Nematocida parisii]|uniref:Uncharacterized protein n=1 Tax=Nematocida parisii (strain ERTm3) TaxID=935791 RepID=I3EJ40_NEMP3|nr:uncharacterized protein NEPG_02475 [Nematocida parisii ERTm1]EIJ89237.1 hypothetical protein NEQG_00007 [Nematocida parisii ERTm3]KAI5125608.1 hypothetical protein NEPAR03_0136 [Nematocida parisii]EIJ92587.1 hypothetical protein NEPG_02475 [Nematocida parisii ERTm1]KAI5125770.1 hypothetical protein NEPAR08_0208 [Nematocida parisii]KAI5140197.1 hypothetical protein NEPAR04_0142 [Nematocida parisii]|eukprot:XP_013060302.1 hypothetical protein NEPG_02475 [Nematocida parisii ERTm1]
MNSSGENSKTKAVAEKVKQTDDKAHEQVQKIKESKLGKAIPTEYKNIGIKQVALISLVLNSVVLVFTYALCIALYPKKAEDSGFAKSISGICLGLTYAMSFCHDFFVYWFERGTMLLSFVGLRVFSLLVTIVVALFLTGPSATILFKCFIILINIIFCLMYMYIFAIYISHLKTGGSTEGGDQQEV